MSDTPKVPRERTRWRRLLQRLAYRLPARAIRNPDGSILFMRYHIYRLPGGGNVYLHHYLQPDPDRGVHDHPWGWARSVVLAGGYQEERLKQFVRVDRGDDYREGYETKYAQRWPLNTYAMTGNDFHRIVGFLSHWGSSWSLFMHGPYVKNWGYMQTEYTRTNFTGEYMERLTFRPGGTEAVSRQGTWYKTAPKGRTFNNI